MAGPMLKIVMAIKTKKKMRALTMAAMKLMKFARQYR